jgi:hypothetical protein
VNEHSFKIEVRDKLRRHAQLRCSCGWETSVPLRSDDQPATLQALLGQLNAHALPLISWRAA